jgi:hypothetical protein
MRLSVASDCLSGDEMGDCVLALPTQDGLLSVEKGHSAKAGLSAFHLWTPPEVQVVLWW